MIEIPVISGPGTFRIEVPVERHIIEPIIGVLGGRESESLDGVVRVLLTLAGDDRAGSSGVSLYIGDLMVGMLPGTTASEFKSAVTSGGLSEFKTFECSGRIRATSSSTAGDSRAYVVHLDIPEDDDRAPEENVASESNDESLIRAYRYANVADRQIDELIGIIKGVMADGIVSHDEVEFLLRWMEANRHAAHVWPAKALYPRLAEVAAKGFMNLQDEREMLDLLMKTVGGNTAPQLGFSSDSTKLPLSEPAQPLSFDGRAFCFTGAFHSGTRDWCHAQVLNRRGRSVANITKKLDYLVIGDIGNELWAHSTHGRKIEKAIEYNATGCKIVIVSEEHWYSHL